MPEDLKPSDVRVVQRLTPRWASRIMLNSLPIARFSRARLWASFRLKVHCALKLHREVVVTYGGQYWCGCQDCEFFPVPVTQD